MLWVRGRSCVCRLRGAIAWLFVANACVINDAWGLGAMLTGSPAGRRKFGHGRTQPGRGT